MKNKTRKYLNLLFVVVITGLILFSCKKDETQGPEPPLPPGIIIHVPQDYPTIKMAADSAGINDTIIVACGEYNEYNIELKAGTSLVSETGLANCVTINADSLGRCLRFKGTAYASSILGITFINGYKVLGEFPDNAGGAIYSEGNAPLTINNCNFTLNSAETGNSLYFGSYSSNASLLTLINCTFNISPNTTTWGGNVFITSNPASIQNCNFVGGKAQYGGAVKVWASPSTNFYGCIFQNNSGSYGGGVAIEEGSVIFDKCTWEGNEADKGGGLQIQETSSALVKNCIFKNNLGHSGGAINTQSSISIQNCVFDQNSAEKGGVILSWGVLILLENCTLVGNSASSGLGAGVYGASGSFNIRRSIISNCLEGTAVYMAESAPIAIECTDIWGNADGDWVGNIEDLVGVNGNFSLDPMFSNTSYNLDPLSPCVPGNNSCNVLIGAMPVGK